MNCMNRICVLLLSLHFLTSCYFDARVAESLAIPFSVNKVSPEFISAGDVNNYFISGVCPYPHKVISLKKTTATAVCQEDNKWSMHVDLTKLIAESLVLELQHERYEISHQLDFGLGQSTRYPFFYFSSQEKKTYLYDNVLGIWIETFATPHTLTRKPYPHMDYMESGADRMFFQEFAAVPGKFRMRPLLVAGGISNFYQVGIMDTNQLVGTGMLLVSDRAIIHASNSPKVLDPVDDNFKSIQTFFEIPVSEMDLGNCVSGLSGIPLGRGHFLLLQCDNTGMGLLLSTYTKSYQVITGANYVERMVRTSTSAVVTVEFQGKYHYLFLNTMTSELKKVASSEEDFFVHKWGSKAYSAFVKNGPVLEFLRIDSATGDVKVIATDTHKPLDLSGEVLLAPISYFNDEAAYFVSYPQMTQLIRVNLKSAKIESFEVKDSSAASLDIVTLMVSGQKDIRAVSRDGRVFNVKYSAGAPLSALILTERLEDTAMIHQAACEALEENYPCHAVVQLGGDMTDPYQLGADEEIFFNAAILVDNRIYPASGPEQIFEFFRMTPTKSKFQKLNGSVTSQDMLDLYEPLSRQVKSIFTLHDQLFW